MENSDQRRRNWNDDPSRGRSRPSYENNGDEQRNFGEQRNYGSDDYAEQRESRDRYHERTHADDREGRRGEPGRWRGDQYRTTTPEQRERGFVPRGTGQGEHDDEQHSPYRAHYSRFVTPYSYEGARGNLYVESWTISGPHTGRGPKGYKRSDQQIVDEASQRLERDGHIDATEIEVTAEDGVLKLRGTVPDRASKRRAEDCVESVYGVRDVMNELHLAAVGGAGTQASLAFQESQSASGSQSRPGGGSAAEQKSTKGSTGKLQG